MNSTRRILIVDDEPEIRMLLAEILRQDGFEIRQAGSAAEADVILRVFPPSLLVTDYSLPDASGSELIERAKGILPRMKCLMLTGWRELADHLSNTSLADVIMSKPFSVEALEREARRLLSAGLGQAGAGLPVAQQTL